MTDESDAEPTAAADDQFAEIREAVGAVVASLKQLIEATERVVADPGAFTEAIDNGKSVVEAFVGGFIAQATASDANTDGEESSPES